MSTVPQVKQAAVDHPIQPTLEHRWSPYIFGRQPVSADVLRSLFEAARWAASSYNEQPWRYIVARREDEPQRFQRIVDCLVVGNRPWAHRVPVLVIGIVATSFERNGKANKAAAHDLGAASAQLTVEATARGLCVHQMIGIDPETTKAVFDLPPGYEVYTALAIGYPADVDSTLSMDPKIAEKDTRPRSRKPLSQFVFGDWEKSAEFLAD